MDPGTNDRPAAVLAGADLQDLIEALQGEGVVVLGPRVRDGAVAIEEINAADDLPIGWTDEQDGGHYRLHRSGPHPAYPGEVFSVSTPSQGWKRVLYPPAEPLWRAERSGGTLAIEAAPVGETCYAFLGIRACDLAALGVLDRVLDERGADDHRYMERRRRALVIAVDCSRPGGTCFCASMDTGPAVSGAYDLVLTELVDADRHDFLVRAGSAAGERIVGRLDTRPAAPADLAAAERLRSQAAQSMGRQMPPDAGAVLRRNLEHGRWGETAGRCLTCGNCTAVCPTCFCTTMEERPSLAGDSAERWRVWDSCFTIEFSYLHGGSIRRDAAARYRQWITHKLAFWHEQFGVSGCVGCGRCITWCPVGIDITEEVRAVGETEQGT